VSIQVLRDEGRIRIASVYYRRRFGVKHVAVGAVKFSTGPIIGLKQDRHGS
jgi:hypothetical protein